MGLLTTTTTITTTTTTNGLGWVDLVEAKNKLQVQGLQ